MKNIDRYSDKLLDIYSSGYKVAINNYTNEPLKCSIKCITCAECLLLNDGSCDFYKFVEWLGEDYVSRETIKKG